MYNELVMGKMIGEGQYGEVFSGTWENTEVAVKLVRDRISDESMKSFMEEISLMR